MRGVVGNLCFEALDHVVRVGEGTTDPGFCTVHEAMKAIGGVLPIIREKMSSLAVGDGGRKKIDVSIEKKDGLLLGCEPVPPNDPRSPPPPLRLRKDGESVYCR